VSKGLEGLSVKEIESMAALLVKALESGEAGRLHGDFQEDIENSGDSRKTDEVPREKLSMSEKELIWQVIKEAVESGEDAGVYGASFSKGEAEASGLLSPEGEMSLELRRGGSLREFEPEYREQDVPDYPEISSESGMDMAGLSRFFDRDSRRYDSAFERY